MGDNVQAFEEKFDIFTMLNITKDNKSKKQKKKNNISNTRRRMVRYQQYDDTQILTQSERYKYTDSWYASPSSSQFLQHNLSGVAILKNFTKHLL